MRVGWTGLILLVLGAAIGFAAPLINGITAFTVIQALLLMVICDYAGAFIGHLLQEEEE